MHGRDALSTIVYGPLQHSGPYTRFLHRALMVAAAWGTAGTAAQMNESMLLRLPHVGPAFPGVAVVAGVTAFLAGLLAAAAMIWEHFVRRGHQAVWPRRWDASWRTLATVSLASYVGAGAYALATTTPFRAEHLELFSNEHPFQRQSIAFAVLAVILLPEWWRAVFLALTTVMMGLLPLVESADPPTPRYFSGAILLLCFNSMYVGAVSWLLRQSMLLDATQATLNRERVASRTQYARIAARKRMNGFIHDYILSVLISVASGFSNQWMLTATARQALTRLDQRAEDRGIQSSSQIFDRIESVARELDPRISVIRRGVEAVTLPPARGEALVEAAHEALTNALRHAWTPERPEPTVCLVLAMSPEAIEIVVADDGPGFDPELSDSARLGIRHSILDRMDAAGGRASLISSPGSGTRVTLTLPVNIANNDTAKTLETSPLHMKNVMKSRVTRIIIGYAIFAHFYQLLAHWDMYGNPWIAMAAFLALTAMAVLLVLPWRDGNFPMPLAFAVPAIGGIANTAVLMQITPHGWPEFESWSIGFIAILCGGLVLYGRLAAAWTGMVFMVLSVLPWVFGNNLSPELAVTLTIGHIITITGWTVVYALARWASVRIISDEHQRMELEAERIENEQAAAVVESMLDLVDGQVRPILQLVANGESLTPAIRRKAELLEAELRDDIRGGIRLPSLVKGPVRAARERGIVAILMDDRGDAPLPRIAENALRDNAARILAATSSGQVVIRIGPENRPTIATITADAERLTIAADGTISSESPDISSASSTAEGARPGWESRE